MRNSNQYNYLIGKIDSLKKTKLYSEQIQNGETKPILNGSSYKEINKREGIYKQASLELNENGSVGEWMAEVMGVVG